MSNIKTGAPTVRIVAVPEHIIGGPFAVQCVDGYGGKVVACTTGVRSMERAEIIAAQYRRTYEPCPVYAYMRTLEG